MTSLSIRPLAEQDLGEADRVFRLAFGTEYGLTDPMSFRGDAEMVKPRWRANPAGAFGAFRGPELIGSSFCARWGSFGLFGPITVRPDLWNSGAGRRLLEPAIALFDAWGVGHTGLFTFAQSPKHVALYQKFGFWPQHLTAVMSKAAGTPSSSLRWLRHSDEPASHQEYARLAGMISPGLDVESEIRAVSEQGLGDTILLRDGSVLRAFAVCHVGKGSEAGSGTTYVKFAAVQPGPDAASVFDRLLSACEALSIERAAPTVVAGVNTARHAAYQMMIQRGYRSFLHGVAMQRPNRPGWNRSDIFVIDDWR